MAENDPPVGDTEQSDQAGEAASSGGRSDEPTGVGGQSSEPAQGESPAASLQDGPEDVHADSRVNDDPLTLEKVKELLPGILIALPAFGIILSRVVSGFGELLGPLSASLVFRVFCLVYFTLPALLIAFRGTSSSLFASILFVIVYPIAALIAIIVLGENASPVIFLGLALLHSIVLIVCSRSPKIAGKDKRYFQQFNLAISTPFVALSLIGGYFLLAPWEAKPGMNDWVKVASLIYFSVIVLAYYFDYRLVEKNAGSTAANGSSTNHNRKAGTPDSGLLFGAWFRTFSVLSTCVMLLGVIIFCSQTTEQITNVKESGAPPTISSMDLLSIVETQERFLCIPPEPTGSRESSVIDTADIVKKLKGLLMESFASDTAYHAAANVMSETDSANLKLADAIRYERCCAGQYLIARMLSISDSNSLNVAREKLQERGGSQAADLCDLIEIQKEIFKSELELEGLIASIGNREVRTQVQQAILSYEHIQNSPEAENSRHYVHGSSEDLEKAYLESRIESARRLALKVSSVALTGVLSNISNEAYTRLELMARKGRLLAGVRQQYKAATDYRFYWEKLSNQATDMGKDKMAKILKNMQKYGMLLFLLTLFGYCVARRLVLKQTQNVKNKFIWIDTWGVVVLLLFVPLVAPIDRDGVQVKDPYWALDAPNWYLPKYGASLVDEKQLDAKQESYGGIHSVDAVDIALSSMNHKLDALVKRVELISDEQLGEVGKGGTVIELLSSLGAINQLNESHNASAARDISRVSSDMTNINTTFGGAIDDVKQYFRIP